VGRQRRSAAVWNELNVFDDFEKMVEVDVASGKTTVGADDLTIDEHVQSVEPLGYRVI
jgi:copper chaperone CopZ